MVEPINLRQERKRRAREAAEAEAATNRRRFGQTTAEKTNAQSDKDRQSRNLDSHRRDIPGEPDPEA